jgi:hypothetical protein
MHDTQHMFSCCVTAQKQHVCRPFTRSNVNASAPITQEQRVMCRSMKLCYHDGCSDNAAYTSH